MSAANGKQQQDLHDLVHFERQPLQIENLRRVAQFGVDQTHIRAPGV